MNPGVRATIETIPEQDWQPLAPHQPDGCWVAETVHTLERSRGAYRLLVIREVRRQVYLLEGPYVHHAVITNIPTHSPRAIIRWHRYTVKTVRFRLLCVAGTVTPLARQLILDLPRDHPFPDIYRQSRFRTIRLAAE